MTHPAYAIADDLQLALSSACLRLCIAGSLRRGKAEPKDIELVAIPLTEERTVKDMFGYFTERHAVNCLDERLDTILAAGVWQFDPVVKRNGPNYKRLVHLPSGLACDLFVTTPRQWGVIFTIRTGSGDYSKSLVTLALRKGMFVKHSLLHNHPAQYDDDHRVKDCPSGNDCIRIIPTPEESDFFRALGVPYLEPAKRTSPIGVSA